MYVWSFEHFFRHAPANVVPLRGTLHDPNEAKFFSVDREALPSSSLKFQPIAPYTAEERALVTGVKR